MEDIKIIEKVEEVDEPIESLKEAPVDTDIDQAFPNIDMPEAPEEEEEEQLPVITDKEFLKEEDVFSNHNTITKMVPVVKKVRKKRTMTEEGLAKLAIARGKAQETRMRNAALRKEGKMKTKKDLAKEQKLADIENKRPVVNNVVHKTENITNNITHEDIMKIATETTAKALMCYETDRKIKKEEKKKKYEADHKNKIIKETLMRATGRKVGEPGFYENCF